LWLRCNDSVDPELTLTIPVVARNVSSYRSRASKRLWVVLVID
jgi:hypothetical protein